MTDTCKFTGNFRIEHNPTSIESSGDFDVNTDLTETLPLKNKVAVSITLNTDDPEVISLEDLLGAHVVLVRSTAEVTVTTVSAKGTGTFGVGKLLLLIDDTTPITSITVQRNVGTTTSVRIILGELQDI